MKRRITKKSIAGYIAAVLVVLVTASGWVYGLNQHSDLNSQKLTTDQYASAADVFRGQRDIYKSDLIDAYKHLTTLRSVGASVYADDLANLTTVGTSDHLIASLASRITNVSQDWTLSWTQQQNKLRPLRQQYASAILKSNDFTYTTVPLGTLGGVTLAGQSYRLDYEDVDGFGAVVVTKQ